jgi:hypothetical protein
VSVNAVFWFEGSGFSSRNKKGFLILALNSLGTLLREFSQIDAKTPLQKQTEETEEARTFVISVRIGVPPVTEFVLIREIRVKDTGAALCPGVLAVKIWRLKGKIAKRTQFDA